MMAAAHDFAAAKRELSSESCVKSAMNRPARLAVGVAAVLLLAACNASPGGSPSPTGVPSPAPSLPGTASPSATPPPSEPAPSSEPLPSASPTNSPAATQPDTGDPDAVILKIEQTGGMLPIWETLRWYPPVTLYADGRLVYQGAQILIYPGPALPSLWTTQLNDRGIDQVLEWAADGGVEGHDLELGVQMMDAGVTVYSVNGCEGTHRTTVHSNMNNDPQINALMQFQDVVTNARQWLDAEAIVGDDAPYVADSLRIISFPAQPQGGDQGLVTTLDWPLDTPIDQLGTSFGEPAEYRCAEVSGDDLATLLPMVEESNELTVWRSGAEGELYQLYLHPLLPDEEACPGF